jgi:hypothetical protein
MTAPPTDAVDDPESYKNRASREIGEEYEIRAISALVSLCLNLSQANSPVSHARTHATSSATGDRNNQIKSSENDLQVASGKSKACLDEQLMSLPIGALLAPSFCAFGFVETGKSPDAAAKASLPFLLQE